MYRSIRPLLFQMDPEDAHRMTLQLLRLAGRFTPARWLLKSMYSVPDHPVEAFGLTFRNPIGLVEDQAVINRMGFPGKGAAFAAQMLKNRERPAAIILGVNLGKNKDTPLERSADDYVSLMRTFSPLADYLAINISSPNTVGLRRLQGRQMLEDLLKAI